MGKEKVDNISSSWNPTLSNFEFAKCVRSKVVEFIFPLKRIHRTRFCQVFSGQAGGSQ